MDGRWMGEDAEDEEDADEISSIRRSNRKRKAVDYTLDSDDSDL